MKKSFWLILFIAVLLADCIGIQLKNETWQFIFKPLLIPVLMGYFLSQTKKDNNLVTWIATALFFSWSGDVLLLFEERNSLFFLLGLSAFLLAQLFYIIFFHHIRIRENLKSNPWLLLIVVIYYAVLMSALNPGFDNPGFHSMKLPVRIYGVVISFMFLLALHMLFLKNKITGRLMILGALLFVVSDSVLAFNKFVRSFEGAGLIIMLTYGLAQLCIMMGAIKYIRGIQE